MFPKTILLGMNLHGEIKLNKEKRPEIRKLPPPIKSLTQLNAVSYGVPNVSRIENYNELIQLTSNFVDNQPIGLDSTPEELFDYVSQLKQLLIKSSEPEIKNIEEYYRLFLSKNHYENENNDTNQRNSFARYIHSLDKSYTIKTTTNGSPIINKIFYKFSQDEQREIGETSPYFNKIVLYNAGNMDLFELLQSVTGYEITEISLYDLIEFFVGVGGVENIVLIDFSCSTFRDSNGNIVNNRTSRALRREIESIL